jgi:osmotically-inducible protein OsmY
MRARHLILLAAALFVGCGEKETRTTRTTRTTQDRTTTPAATDSPRTTADRNMPSTSGTTTTTTTEERTAARPVIEDPNKDREPDNTGINKRDADTALTKTPGDQGQSKAEVDTTAAIRKRVTDMDLSTNADNVKIITENGKVTLRGPVESDEEKQTIERLAREIAGEGNVTSELQVDKD